MNFLGHLFFSDSDLDLMYANLFGDFVKGSSYLNTYSNKIVQGVKLHREIDHYFNTHSSILNVQRKLYKDLPKVSGIAMDLYADYYIASNWNDYSDLLYQDYLDTFYAYDPFLKNSYPSHFKEFIYVLKKKRWMDYYNQEIGLDFASKGVSKRILFPNSLGLALDVYKLNKCSIDNAISTFMKSGIKKFLS